MHIYDAARFPPPRPDARMQPDAAVADYRLFQQRIGTSRTVVVNAAAYATDNEVTLDAVAKLGDACGIAVVVPSVTDAELKRLADGKMRGIRFTQFDPKTATTTLDMIEPLAKRAQDFGMHVQIHLRADQIVSAQDMLMRLPGTVVLDHLGRLTREDSIRHQAFNVIRRMLDNGRTWMKLSGAYMIAEPPDYTDATKIGRAYVEIAPERMVWGSDWPHPTEKEKPDDAALFDLLTDWAPDDSTRHRILVDNPATLYNFRN
jgi:predicted TIM-barrel fold metal-dependent hydrolase